MPIHADILVVGTGGVGSAALSHLAGRGVRVLGIDRFPGGHDRGSSHGHSRIIRLAYFEHSDYVPLLHRAYDLWADLERKHQQLEKARKKLDAFTKAHPNHRLAPESLVEVALLLYERGRTAMFQEQEARAPADKQLKLNEARASFDDARVAYDRAQAPLGSRCGL